MRKSATVLALGLLAATLTTIPAHAADPVVTIAWADSTHKAVRVTWPTDDKANDVQVMLHGNPAHVVTTAADAADTVDIPVTAFPKNEDLRIEVRAVNSPTSSTVVGSSAVFDTDLRFDGYIQELQPKADGTLGLTWIYTGSPDDAADPLDLPIAHTGGPLVSTPTGCDWQQVGSMTGAPVSTIMANRTRPHQLRIRSNEERGNRDSVETWEIDNQAVTPLSLPSVANFNQTVTLKGKLELVRPGACAAGKPRPTVRSVMGNYLVLQGRSSSTAPWVQVVGSVYTNPATGLFEVNIPARGTRQYRVFAPAVPEVDGFSRATGFQGLSSNLTVTTRYQLNSAKFADTTVAPGKPATVSIGVAPANNVTATLQKWNGAAWLSVKAVGLVKGAGQYTFAAPAAGNHAYRFVVPSSTYNGLPIAGITTGTMTLVVR